MRDGSGLNTQITRANQAALLLQEECTGSCSNRVHHATDPIQVLSRGTGMTLPQTHRLAFWAPMMAVVDAAGDDPNPPDSAICSACV